MSQQISIEDAFPTFQKKVRELFEANLLLQAQVDVLERRVAELAQQGADGEQSIADPSQNPSTM